MLDGSNDSHSHKRCAFGGFVDITPHFGGVIPPKPQFWGVNRRLQAKLANIEFHIIEKLLHRFQPNFAQQRPPSGHREWSQYAPNKSKLADGHDFAKTVKLPYLYNLLTNLYTNDLPVTCSCRFNYGDNICGALQAETFSETVTLTADLAHLAKYCQLCRLKPSTSKTVTSVFRLHNC